MAPATVTGLRRPGSLRAFKFAGATGGRRRRRRLGEAAAAGGAAGCGPSRCLAGSTGLQSLESQAASATARRCLWAAGGPGCRSRDRGRMNIEASRAPNPTVPSRGREMCSLLNFFRVCPRHPGPARRVRRLGESRVRAAASVAARTWKAHNREVLVRAVTPARLRVGADRRTAVSSRRRRRLPRPPGQRWSVYIP